MHLHHGALGLIFTGILASQPLGVSAQAPGSQAAGALKRADAAFRAGYAAQQAGDLESARAHFADAVRLAPPDSRGA